MPHISSKATAVVAAAAALVASATVGLSTAAADPDPITGGTTTIDITLQGAQQAASNGIFAIPGKPATLSYDAANKAVEYAFPVTGGDGSVSTFYGAVETSGGLLIVDRKTGKSVTLSSLTFTVQDDTLSATPAGASSPVVLFDAGGEVQFNTSQPESFSASELTLDGAGATYLNKKLRTGVFKAGQLAGTFSTSFTNTVDGG